MNLHEMQGNRCIMLFFECKYLPLGVQCDNSPYKLANFLSYITYNFERKCGSGMRRLNLKNMRVMHFVD